MQEWGEFWGTCKQRTKRNVRCCYGPLCEDFGDAYPVIRAPFSGIGRAAMFPAFEF